MAYKADTKTLELITSAVAAAFEVAARGSEPNPQFAVSCRPMYEKGAKELEKYVNALPLKLRQLLKAQGVIFEYDPRIMQAKNENGNYCMGTYDPYMRCVTLGLLDPKIIWHETSHAFDHVLGPFLDHTPAPLKSGLFGLFTKPALAPNLANIHLTETQWYKDAYAADMKENSEAELAKDGGDYCLPKTHEGSLFTAGRERFARSMEVMRAVMGDAMPYDKEEEKSDRRREGRWRYTSQIARAIFSVIDTPAAPVRTWQGDAVRMPGYNSQHEPVPA